MKPQSDTRKEIEEILLKPYLHISETINALEALIARKQVEAYEAVIKDLDPYFESTTLYRKVENFCNGKIAELKET